MTESALFTNSSTHSELEGAVGKMVQAVTENWLLVAPLANPAMLEMFADRDNRPYRNMMPWAGEFAGKYLTSAVQIWRLTRDGRLKQWLETFVSRLVELQDQDGYLGPWPADCRLTNYSPYHGAEGMATWDTWGHYHIMTGLLLWNEDSRDERALACACRMADLICQKYLGQKTVRLVDTSWPEMNLAPVHSLARLYRVTGVSRYLDMALQIVDEFAAQGPEGPLAGDYLNHALAGKNLYEMPKPRWESLHAILGMAELYWITADERYRKAFEQIWWGIAEFDRHNNGGFSSGEQATGNPYDQGTIETCCTIAWMALSVEMLKMTGSSLAADELELSTLNSILGMHSPTGRWSTFTTPMDGTRFASSQAIGFQARSGSPELNCCSVNSPRGFGLLSDWAVMQRTGQEGLVVNYYGPSTLYASLSSGATVEIRQETTYPVSGKILLQVNPAAPARFTLSLRIPAWSQQTHLLLNHEEIGGESPLQAGRYFEIERQWQPGDSIEIDLDMSLHFWSGERQCQGMVSIYRGPLLLAYDQRFNKGFSGVQTHNNIPDDCFKVSRDHLCPPTLDASQMTFSLIQPDGWFAPNLLIEMRTPTGEPVRLCDFASAGQTGALYRSWLPVVHAPPAPPFSRQKTLRSIR